MNSNELPQIPKNKNNNNKGGKKKDIEEPGLEKASSGQKYSEGHKEDSTLNEKRFCM